MKFVRRRRSLLLLALILSSASIAAYCCDNDKMSGKPLEELVDQIAQEVDDLARAQKSELLVEALSKRGIRIEPGLNDRIVIEVASLLEDPNASVRANSAKALGILGIRAKKALPALQRARERELRGVKEGEFLAPGTPLSAIEFAIYCIAGQGNLKKADP